MSERQTNFASEILKSFNESQGDATVLVSSLEKKGLVDQLPNILNDPQIVATLAQGYVGRHPDHARQALAQNI